LLKKFAADPPCLVKVGAEDEAAQAENVLGSGFAPEHAGGFEPASDNGFAPGFDNAASDEVS
jgi:hypothetical protein